MRAAADDAFGHGTVKDAIFFLQPKCKTEPTLFECDNNDGGKAKTSPEQIQKKTQEPKGDKGRKIE